MSEPALTPLPRLRARHVAYEWAWARDNADRVAANWARRREAAPALFDGRVLLACGARTAGEAGAFDLFETAYASFLAHRDAGSPDAAVANVFAAIVPHTSDGAVLLGRMGAHTANAGLVYFPCGTPDLADLRADGSVDLAGSAVRECAEETGLTVPPDAPRRWLMLRDPGLIALLRPVWFPEPAADLLARMEAHRTRDAVPELAGFATVRGMEDVESAHMPGFARRYLASVFAGGRSADGDLRAASSIPSADPAADEARP